MVIMTTVAGADCAGVAGGNPSGECPIWTTCQLSWQESDTADAITARLKRDGPELVRPYAYAPTTFVTPRKWWNGARAVARSSRTSFGENTPRPAKEKKNDYLGQSGGSPGLDILGLLGGRHVPGVDDVLGFSRLLP